MSRQDTTAVIFDLDGTLLDTLQDLTAAVNEILAAYGYPPRSLGEVRSFIGNGIAKLVERSIPQTLDARTLSRITEEYRDCYRRHLLEQTKPYPGIVELLGALKASGVPIGVVTNKFHAGAVLLTDTLLAGQIDVTIGEQPQLPKKPAPDMVCEAMRQLGVEKAVYVGDSHVDIQTARNADLEVILVDWGFEDRQSLAAAGAERICSDAEELCRCLREKGVEYDEFC